MKELLPGIYQMTLTLSGFNPGSINVYLLKDSGGYTLVDTGWDTPPAVSSMVAQLAEFNIGIEEIKRILITHCHIDHLGMSGRFKKSNQATVYFHKNEIDLMNLRFQNGDQYLPLTDMFLQQHGFPKSELVLPEVKLPEIIDIIEPDGLFKGGEEIQVGQYRLTVINTPGHTPGHVSYYEAHHKILISGDVLLPDIDTNAALHVQHMPNPLHQYMDSLHLLREMDINLVLPGHGYVFSNHRERIDEIVLHHNIKQNEILNTLTYGQPKTAYEVSRVLSWSPQNKSTAWDNLTAWDKRFAVLQTIAHLEELKSSDHLTRFSRDGKLYYR
jgi:glyoxylase-like metal-dependent hydrolase (beta-lactamase superfamily II)